MSHSNRFNNSDFITASTGTSAIRRTFIDSLPSGFPELPPRHRTKIDSAVLGMVLVLMAETMLFAGLVGATVMMRNKAMVWPPADLPRLPRPITLANMAVLLGSGVLLFLGRRKSVAGAETNSDLSASSTQGDSRATVLAAAMLGILFFCVQAVEWVRLLAWDGATGPFAGIFFAMVGTHAIHVLGGVIALTWAAVTTPVGSELRRIKICSMYWYFVVLVWPVIYGLVYH